MKFNMGCGNNKLTGYINVDKYSDCIPDLKLDLEITPWPIQDNCASEVVFNHSLEHMGQTTDVFLNIIKELYRICKPDAKVIINVPNPRHDYYIGDPTHVRPITHTTLCHFSKKNNEYWKSKNATNTPLAFYMNVDFDIVQYTKVLDAEYQQMFIDGVISSDEIEQLEKECNNIVEELNFVLKVIK